MTLRSATRKWHVDPITGGERRVALRIGRGLSVRWSWNGRLVAGAAYAVVVSAILCAVALPAVASAILPLSSDQGLYITIGEILKRGGVVGRDTWDTKPPGVYELYAAVLAFAPDYSTTCTFHVPVGPTPEHQVACAQVVLSTFNAAYTLALVAAVWWLTQRLFGAVAGAAAAALCAVYASMLQVTELGGLADIYVLLPVTLSYAAAAEYERTRRLHWLLLAGAFGGFATLFKQTGLLLLAGVGVWLIARRCFRACAILAAGASVVFGATAAVLLVVGNFGEVVEQSILFNFYYVGRPANVNNFFIQLIAQTWSVFSGSQSGLWIAGLAGLAMLWRRSALLITWAAASVATVLAGGAQLHVNYYVALVPPMSVAGGYFVAVVWRRGRLLWRLALVVGVVLGLYASSRLQYREYGNAWCSRIISNTHFRCSQCRRRFARRSSSAFSGRAFPDDIIALAVRYRLSYAEVSEWLAERGVLVDQSTIYRWVQRFLPLFGEAARKHRDPIGPDWRVDETYARISGRWHYIYRAIDGRGQIVDAYVSPTRDLAAAHRFFERAIASTGTTPRRVITDKAATYPPALAAAVPGVLHRTGRYRTNGIERDHGFLKERLRPMRGLKSVASAAIFMRGHALMRNIHRGFYSLVESVPQRLVFAWTWTRLAEAV